MGNLYASSAFVFAFSSQKMYAAIAIRLFKITISHLFCLSECLVCYLLIHYMDINCTSIGRQSATNDILVYGKPKMEGNRIITVCFIGCNFLK